MLAKGYRFLKRVNYVKFDTWAVNRYVKSHSFNTKHGLVQLSKILSPRKIRIKPSEYDITMPVVEKIRFSDGKIFFRENPVPKNDFFLAELNDLIVSNINFEKGAFDINEYGQIATSTDYQPYEIIYDLDFQYFKRVLRSDRFLTYVKSIKPEGMKTRARFDFIKTLEIPLPTSTEQKDIVNQYNITFSQAEECEAKAKNLEGSIEKILFEELEIDESVVKKSNTFKYLTNIKLSSLSRWDIWNKKEKFFSEKYTTNTLSSICSNPPLYGANEKAIKEKSDTRYIRITDINEDGSLNNDFVSATKVEEKYLLKENDFLIARSGNTVGKTFLYKKEYGKCIFAGYLIKFTLDTNKILPEYLLHYTKSFIFKDWIASNQRIFGQPNINGQEYLSASIILPPLDIQQEISQKITKIKTEIKELRQIAEDLRIKAKSDFEKEVFSE